MSFWCIFMMLLLIVAATLITTFYVYETIRISHKIDFKLIFIILAESLLLVVFVALFSHAAKNTFDNIVKDSYYKGVSVKVIPKINSDYKIERMDSVFYINE